MVLSKIHAVSTQGLALAIILAALAGFAGGHFYKVGSRSGGTSSKGGNVLAS